MLQETKLQDMHVPQVEAELLETVHRIAGGGAWRVAWSTSSARKGYAGVATIWCEERLGVRAINCFPLEVDPSHEAGLEGRTLLLDLPLPSNICKSSSIGLVNVYTPNAGASLERLEYRTGVWGWDERFRLAVADVIQTRQGRAIVGGDLNVAVEDVDFFNPNEKRMEKQAGTTPEERESMRGLLRPSGCFAGFSDAFRVIHPAARGQYTYWSQRAGNRAWNRGLRLDYFLVSRQVEGCVADVEHLRSLGGSDHCPVKLVLDLEKLRD